MGTTSSSIPAPSSSNDNHQHNTNNTSSASATASSANPTPSNKPPHYNKYKSFPGSAILEKTFCGSIDTTDPAEYEDVDLANRLLKKADIMCVSTPERYSSNRNNNRYYDATSPEEIFLYDSAGNTPHNHHHGDDNDDDYSDDNDEDDDYHHNEGNHSDFDDDDEGRAKRRRRRRRSGATSTTSSAANAHPSSALLARALVNEVTNNPKTMKPAEMALREYKLLKAQKAAVAAKRKSSSSGHGRHGHNNINDNNNSPQAVGAPGVGVGPPNVLNSLAFAVTGDESAGNLGSMGVNVCVHPTKDAVGGIGGGGGGGGANNSSMMPPGPFQENRAAQEAANNSNMQLDPSNSDPNAWIAHPEKLPPHTITLGLSLSRRHAKVGHKETVTRQTAFDFNELQDRSYKYVSSTDEYGWRAGGGESGGPPVMLSPNNNDNNNGEGGGDHNMNSSHHHASSNGGLQSPLSQQPNNNNIKSEYYQEKIAAPDTVHIPIIQIPCRSEAEVDQVIHALASGDIFIPHMAVLPEILSVNGISPPDLVVRFGCERNDDLPPDEWPNWCLEFMHNQLYEYFYAMGAKWTKRPFSITLARKVKWKTVKHMNRYFAHAERVIEGWRQKGPQMLDPQLSYIEGGASPEEVAHPHGIYLMRSNGVATNYFCPNFDPPYTTKMTRSLLENVLNKSWDRKRREWTSDPIPRLVTPNMLLAMACGCTTDPTSEGFMAKEVTMSSKNATASKAKQEQQEAQMLLTMVTASSTHSSTKKQTTKLSSSSLAVDASVIKPTVATTTASFSGKAAATPKTEASSIRSSPVGGEVHIDTISSMNSNGEISVITDCKQTSPTTQQQQQQSPSSSSQKSFRETQYEEKKMDDEPHHQHQEESQEQQLSVVQEQVVMMMTHNKIKMASPAPNISPSNNAEEEMTTTRSEFGGAATSVAAASQFGAAAASIAMSSTTVMHTNVTATRTVARKQQQQQQQLSMINSRSQDEQEDDEHQKDPWKSVSSPTSLSSSSSSRKGKSYDGESVENANPEHANKTTHHDSKKVRDLLDLERKRQDELLSQVRSDSNPDKKIRQYQQASKSTAAAAASSSTSITYVLSPTTAGNTNINSPTRRSSLCADLEGSDSGQSMEYSQDGSSAYLTDGASTIVGQNFAGDQSVLTMTSRQSAISLSTTTTSAMNIKKQQHRVSTTASTTQTITATSKNVVAVEAEMDNLSLQESSSSVMSIVPTDEELFSIGWAKALDPNSGNYYYFTLDRKKIVWDNPLNPSSAHSMGESTA